MQDYSGNINFPIWLVADSEPKNWQSYLDVPLDPRHPARHNIWTPVLDYMQDYLFRRSRRRFSTDNLYVVNAIKNPADKPKGTIRFWSASLMTKVNELQNKLSHAEPKIVLTFGAFAFEFLRRACKESPQPFCHWGTKELGREFRRRVSEFDKSQVNIIPLLHVSIARGKFLESHKYFVGEEDGNYFEFVGNHLARLFLKELALGPIWIE